MAAKGSNISANATGAGSPEDDPVLLALEDLLRASAKVTEAADRMAARAEHIRSCRDRGASYRDIVTGEQRPLIAEILTGTIHQFETAGTRFRQAEARALHDEGLTMEQIAELFGLTRQRISALLRDASAPAKSMRTGG